MSIKRRLISLIIATVTLASFFAALHGYRNSVTQLDTILDKELTSLANFILATAKLNPELPSNITGDFAYVVIKNNQVYSKSQHFSSLTPITPQVVFELMINRIGFDESAFFGKRWRTYAIKENEIQVIVAQQISTRITSAESILFNTITPIVISIPLIALIIFYIVGESLKPLISLSLQLKKKSTDDLTKINLDALPIELEPVVTRLNNLFSRLDYAFEREKQLTANAAHELRTPASVLAINAHNILQDFNRQLLTESSIIELQHNVERMAHVIEQIIALYRFNPENFHEKQQLIDIESVLQEVISNNYEEITAHHQNVSLESNGEQLPGERFALYTLFENLIRNAIKYSGEQQYIRIIVSQTQIEQKPFTVISVEDSGPGIPDNDIPYIFERFYRAKFQHSRVKGSGLGLSIVKHICDLHHGAINCSISELGGLCVKISLPSDTPLNIENSSIL